MTMQLFNKNASSLVNGITSSNPLKVDRFRLKTNTIALDLN